MNMYHLLSGFSLMVVVVMGGFVHAESNDETLYTSPNLFGHEVFAECNPGRSEQPCECSPEDVGLLAFEKYGAVISNIRQQPTYVNAIGYKKFADTFPDGRAIMPGIYTYTAQVRLPVLPVPDDTQTENPQAVHLMIQYWNGRNTSSQREKTTLEGAIYWDLNPWTSPHGTIKVYTNSSVDGELELFDTGLQLPPDTAWHTFELVVDLSLQRYVSVTVDAETRDLSPIPLAQVPQPDWGDDVSFTITTESMAASPQENCWPVFTWTTHFKDVELSILTSDIPGTNTPAPVNVVPEPATVVLFSLGLLGLLAWYMKRP